MALNELYITIAVIALLVIGVLVFFMNKGKTRKLSPLAGVAFVFVIAGITFGDDRLIGYSLMGVGIILAIIDTIIKSRKK